MRIDPEIAQSFRPLTRLDFAFRAHVGLGSNSAVLLDRRGQRLIPNSRQAGRMPMTAESGQLRMR